MNLIGSLNRREWNATRDPNILRKYLGSRKTVHNDIMLYENLISWTLRNKLWHEACLFLISNKKYGPLLFFVIVAWLKLAKWLTMVFIEFITFYNKMNDSFFSDCMSWPNSKNCMSTFVANSSCQYVSLPIHLNISGVNVINKNAAATQRFDRTLILSIMESSDYISMMPLTVHLLTVPLFS